MGCVYSSLRKPFSNIKDDVNRRVFDVVNIDDRQNENFHGQIRITDNDLIFDQKNKTSVVWPLRSLRKYGFEQELFSFESGRRCTTGPGMYAFKCVQAEQLFNCLQEVLQRLGNSSSNNVHSSTNVPSLSPQHVSNGDRNAIALSSNVHQPSLPRISSPPHPYVNDVRGYMNSPVYVNTGVSSTISGHPMPANVSSFNCSGNSRAGSVRSASDINTNYAKLDDLYHYVNIHTNTNVKDNEPSQPHSSATTQTTSNPLMTLSSSHLTNASTAPNVLTSVTHSNLNNTAHVKRTSVSSMNEPIVNSQLISGASKQDSVNSVDKEDRGRPPSLALKVEKEPLQSDKPKPISISPKPSRSNSRSESLEITETPDPLNYVVLDLKNTVNNNVPVCVTTGPATPISKTMKENDFNLPLASPPSTPTSLKSISSYPPQSYATIDFDKTMALSSSVVNHRKI
ncbi:uncharacterized protein LOC141852776 [Brevipalpus obovatus]|uniref:uncharacterized protein LOC141852776 n=1 Tax=Brevipalpus obovatus TaxID=246614 RepID=UPI003D9ED8BD